MIHFVRSVLMILLIACCPAMLRAQEAGTERTIGKLLLLRSGRVMEGEIEKIGSQICIRNGMSEITISAERAVKICADWDDVDAQVRALLKADDANDCVKFARWYQMNGRTEKALEQARKALELQPSHGDALQIVTMLERALLERTKNKPTPRQDLVVPAQATPPTASVDVTSETLVGFVSRVQPILMNTCATCHATGRGGPFHLERVTSASQKAATEKNLARVLSYIDFEHPAISPLLVKAVMKHGSASQAPIKDRSVRAFQTVQDWIVQTIVRNPHLKEYQAAQKAPEPAVPPRLSAGSKKTAQPLPGSALVPAWIEAHQRSQAPEVKTTPPMVLSATATQTPLTTPLDDPHDPDIFNRHYHPAR